VTGWIEKEGRTSGRTSASVIPQRIALKLTPLLAGTERETTFQGHMGIPRNDFCLITVGIKKAENGMGSTDTVTIKKKTLRKNSARGGGWVASL